MAKLMLYAIRKCPETRSRRSENALCSRISGEDLAFSIYHDDRIEWLINRFSERFLVYRCLLPDQRSDGALYSRRLQNSAEPMMSLVSAEPPGIHV